MPSTSTAYVLIPSLGYRYSFDGVTSISHSLSLKISTDSDSSSTADTVNNARNEPDVVSLSVVASDAHVPVIGWTQQTFRSLAQIKELRLLCRVVTPLRTYDNMLLSALSVLQDDTCPDGWTGTLTFTQAQYVTWNPDYHAPAAGTYTNSNSSTVTNTGSAAAKTVSGSAAAQTLSKAGIK